MATNTSKIDTAAQKAYAEAAAKKAAASSAAKLDASAPTSAAPVAAKKPAPAKADAPKAAPATTIAKKTTAKKVAKKPTSKKLVSKKSRTQKAAAKKTPATKTAAKRKLAAASSIVSTKETLMSKAQTKTANFTAKAQEGLADFQARAKAAADKSSEIANEMGDFTKGNVEAIVESSKIFAAGMQDIAKDYITESKAAAETVTADIKDIAAVKSPTEFVELQSKITSRNFDTAVSTVSKNTETFVKLANDTFAPISGRLSLAMEKIRKVA